MALESVTLSYNQPDYVFILILLAFFISYKNILWSYQFEKKNKMDLFFKVLHHDHAILNFGFFTHKK